MSRKGHADRWHDLLLPVGRVVRALAHELTMHTDEEEERLFPAILAHAFFRRSAPPGMGGSGRPLPFRRLLGDGISNREATERIRR